MVDVSCVLSNATRFNLTANQSESIHIQILSFEHHYHTSLCNITVHYLILNFSRTIGDNLRIFYYQLRTETRTQTWRRLPVPKQQIPAEIRRWLPCGSLFGNHVGCECATLSGNLHSGPVSVTSLVYVLLDIMAGILLSRLYCHRVDFVQRRISCPTKVQV